MHRRITAAAGQAAFSHPRGRAIVVLLAVLTLGSAGAAPAPAAGYTWTAWTTRYYTASASECQASKAVMARVTGEVPYSSSCVYRVRSRTALINNWAGWTDQLLQLENAAPYWSGAWGMRLQVTMHTNGTRVRYEPASLICNRWYVIVQVKETACRVIGDNTAAATARLAYEVSWSWSFANVGATRGAQVTVFASGSKGAPVRWP